MKKASLPIILVLTAALLSPGTSRGADYLLYAPRAAEADRAPASPDEGVLVRSVTVRRGDTLKKLSRKYLGRSAWFPQVLVFNKIKNPDVIHTGQKLQIPVPPGQTVATREHANSVKHTVAQPQAAFGAKVEPERRAPGAEQEQTVHPVRQAPKQQPAAPKISEPPTASRPSFRPEPPAGPEEQESFMQAKLAYLKGDYQKSLDLFTQFLRSYPRSISAADAELYRADSLLHLSGR